MRIFSRGVSFTLAGSRRCASSFSSCFLNRTRFEVIAMASLKFSVGQTLLSGTADTLVRQTGVSALPLTLPERHAELPQQLAGLVVARRRGDDGDVHALSEGDFVGVDLGE